MQSLPLNIFTLSVGECSGCDDSDGHHLRLSKRNRGRLRGDHAPHGALQAPSRQYFAVLSSTRLGYDKFTAFQETIITLI